MKFETYGQNNRDLYRLVLLLASVIFILSIGLVFAINYSNSIKERIVVVPPGLSGPVAIDWGRADAEYIKTFGLFYATLVGSINPRNVEYVADRLTAMTSKSAYPAIRRSLQVLSKDPLFMDQGTSSSFVYQALNYEPERNKVFVIGEVRVQGTPGQTKVFPTTYEMTITIEEGMPIVHSVDNYPGSEPHTYKWLLEHPEWNKEKDSFK